MSLMLVGYIIGVVLVGLGAAVTAERERRTSIDPAEQDAILLPGFIGLFMGLIWPAVAVITAFICMLWLVALPGRLVLDVWDRRAEYYARGRDR